jgi:hypothetical protein
MTRPLLVLFALAVALPAVAADPKKDYGTLFPAIGGAYMSKIEKPEVGKGDPPEVYSQVCTYTCNEPSPFTGETVTVTIARDPAFKEKYSAEAMKKEKAKEVKVGKKKGYLWADDKTSKLVVVLADDKVVIAEQTGTFQKLPEWAGRWKLDAMAKALDTPPAVK